MAALPTTAPRRRGHPIEPQKSKSPGPTPWIVLATGLSAIAVIGLVFAPRKQEPPPPEPKATPAPPPAPSGSAPPNELGIRDFAVVDPIEALGRARARAISWHPDAVLISVRADPVVGGGVDLTAGGVIEYRFGRPAGEGFGAGAHVSPQRFTISLTKDGEKVAESNGGPARAAIDPNCPFEDALRKVRASGVASDLPLSVNYEFSDKHTRTIFRVGTPGNDALSRALDGQSCAILVR
jgi:hypothetical protein